MVLLFPSRAARRAALLLPLAAASTLPTAHAQDRAPLDPIVVTANRTPQLLSSVLADLTVVDRDEIERSGVTGVADLLARLPGIELSRNGGPGNATSVFIRGNEARHTAVYLDGMRIDSQSTGGATWEQIPLDQIDRIEVLRGPAAAVYGSDAVAGVVQMFTRRGRGAMRPTAALTLGSHESAQVQAGVSGGGDSLDYAVSAAHGRSDGFDARTDEAAGHNPDEDGWKRSSLQGRVGYRIDTVHRLDASMLVTRLVSDYDGFNADADEQNRHGMRTGRLAWEARWNDDATTQAQLGATRSSYETQPDFYRTDTTLRDVMLQHEQRIGMHRLSGTLERRDDELQNAATAFGPALEGKRHQNALGLGWRAEAGDHALQAHVRHDDDSEFGGRNTGSLAWGWSFMPRWRVTAQVSTAFRAPTLYQRFSEYGNASLRPENGRNVELGLRWAEARQEASLTVWRNRVSNLINFGAAGPCASAFGCYENVGNAELKGATLSGRTEWSGVTLRASLDWHDPRNRDTDLVLARRARRMATLGADTALAGWTFGAEWQGVGRRFDDAGNTLPMGGYGVVNVVASRPLVPGLVLQARVDNVGDKAYETARTYATGGRELQVSLRWTMP